jgi:hypothetical protein
MSELLIQDKYLFNFFTELDRKMFVIKTTSIRFPKNLDFCVFLGVF